MKGAYNLRIRRRLNLSATPIRRFLSVVYPDAFFFNISLATDIFFLP